MTRGLINLVFFVFLLFVIASNAQSVFDIDMDNNNTFCHFRLYIPEACLTVSVDPRTNRESRTSTELTVLNFYFKNGWSNGNPEQNEVNEEVTEFCEFSELPKFPFNCIKQVANFSFRDHVRCPRQNVVELDAPALWIEKTTYANPLFKQTYRRETTGLVLNCFSNHILQIRSSEKVQFSGIDLKLGKTTKSTLANFIQTHNITTNRETKNEKSISIKSNNSMSSTISEPDSDDSINWIDIQIPKSLKSGALEGYTGNYTLYYLDGKHEEVEVQNYEILIHDPILPTNANNENAILLRIGLINIQCEAPNNKHIYLTNVGGENPLETRLLQRCLPPETSCVAKNVGLPCWKNRNCSNLDHKLLKLNGLVFCSHGGRNATQEYFTGLDLVINKTDPHEVCSEILIQLRVDDGKKLLTPEDEDEKKDENGCKLRRNMTVYEKLAVDFECQYLPYILVPRVVWNVKYKNNSVIKVHVTETGSKALENEQLVDRIGPVRIVLDIKSAKFSMNFTTDVIQVSCSASYWDSSVFVNSTINLQVLPTTIPKFDEDSRIEKTLEIEAGHDFNITCESEKAVPPPAYEWELNQKKITSNENCIKIMHDSLGESSLLSVCNAGKSHEGTFTCRAINFLGSDKKMFEVRVKQVTSNAWIYFGISLGFIALLLPIIFILYRIYLTQRAQLSELEIAAFINGDEKELKNNKLAHENAQYLPYNKEYEVLWKDFQMEGEKILGQGEYGIVLRGEIDGRVVAAKTVRPTAEKSVVLALLSELKIMIYLGNHDNIVQLIGACTAMLKQGKPYVFVEFCENGDLHSYLQDCRPYFVDEFNQSNSDDLSKEADRASLTNGGTLLDVNEKDKDGSVRISMATPTPSKAPENCSEDPSKNSKKVRNASTYVLMQWASDIASGMEYLENKKVIHGDLAARNILVTSSFGVKITDFGLSRQLQNNYTQYVKKQQAALPWRWMAIESLSDMVFTSKSDVWAYGITIWEFFTLAQLPYAGLTYTLNYVEQLRHNLRLPKPQYADVQIYAILMECWKVEPTERPSFAYLKKAFADLIPKKEEEASNYMIMG